MNGNAHQKIDRLDRPVGGGPAKALSIDPADLPALGRPWTKRDVRDLRAARPGWLIEARKRHGAAVAAAAKARAEALAAKALVLSQTLVSLGYAQEDQGTEDQFYLHVERAILHLRFAQKCTEEEAEAAAWLLWPMTMAVTEDAEDAADWW